MNAHFYADDTQLYAHCPATDTIAHVKQVADCVARVEHWLYSNRLKLNTGKTEMICLGTRQQVDRAPVHTFELRSTTVQRASQVRDLGFILYEHLTMSAHILVVVRPAFYQLRQIRTVVGSL